MQRLNISFPEETRAQLQALAPRYGGNISEATRIAIARLYHYHFNPESTASDAVLEHVRKHLDFALSYVDGEQMRRAEMADRIEQD